MPLIKLETIINADPKIVFDLARNIDLHQISTKHTNEKAIAGRVSGLIALNETVTWQAKHFGVTQKLNQGSPSLKMVSTLLTKWRKESLSQSDMNTISKVLMVEL